MVLVHLNDTALVILPTHRLISNLRPISSERLRDLLQKHFQMEEVRHDEAGARDA